MIIKHLALIFIFQLSAALAGNTEINSFRQAKKIAAKIHESYPYTLYCGCTYKGKTVDLISCGFIPKKANRRSRSLEWEHVVPAENFGKSFSEWRVGDSKCVKKGKAFKGRKCAETNLEFARMESDLYNLWPEISEINRARSNYSMAELGLEKELKGDKACRFKIENRKFEPMPKAKGRIARIYMYMDKAYPGHGIISGKNQKLFEAWDKLHPADLWECKRAKMIEKEQGNENTVLKERCKRL